jgi:hypothetical protein
MTNANQPRRSQDRSGVSKLPAFLWRRNIVSDVVQGIIVGGVLAFITFQIIAHFYVTKVDGWTTMYRCGEPSNGILLRGACSAIFPGPINVPQEAMYRIGGFLKQPCFRVSLLPLSLPAVPGYVLSISPMPPPLYGAVLAPRRSRAVMLEVKFHPSRIEGGTMR